MASCAPRTRSLPRSSPVMCCSRCVGYVVVYALFVSFGFYYIYKLLRDGPTVAATPIPGATPNRPLAFADDAASATGGQLPTKL